MTKDRSEEIRERLMSNYPVDSIELYVIQQIDKSVKRNNTEWVISMVGWTIILIVAFQASRPAPIESVKGNKVLGDSIKVRYQKRLDVIVDSIVDYNSINPPKHYK